MADQIEHMGVMLETHQKVCLYDTCFSNYESLNSTGFMLYLTSILHLLDVTHSNLRSCRRNIMSRFDNVMI